MGKKALSKIIECGLIECETMDQNDCVMIKCSKHLNALKKADIEFNKNIIKLLKNQILLYKSKISEDPSNKSVLDIQCEKYNSMITYLISQNDVIKNTNTKKYYEDQIKKLEA